MIRIAFPVSAVDPVLPVKVQLVHPEGHPEIFRLPKLFIGVAVPHPQFAHYAAAARIVNVVGGGDVGELRPQPVYYSACCFGADAFAPVFPADQVTKIMAFIVSKMDVADGRVVSF